MTIYADQNPKTKKAFKEAVANGDITFEDLYSVGGWPDEVKDYGTLAVCGPHYPKPHSWYASVKVHNGKIISVK